MKSVLQYTGIVVLVLTLAIASAARAENPSTAKTRPPARLAVIPQPVHCRTLSGNFVLSGKTEIVYASGLGALARLAAGQLGIRAAMQEGGSRDNAVHLFLDSSVAAEDYKLDITPGRITIVGGSSTGVFYGVQTLRQILGPSPITDFAKVPCLSIQDQPRFAWRGLMLDCSRTFQSLDYLRKTIDRMAFYKMNVLHLHLTDDQGWRMEIRKYPELTRKGAHFSPKHKEPLSHEGCYTQAELKELVAYAALRGIAIVPEIEMPGHSLALLVCRPELSCAGKTADDIFPLSKGPLITVNVLCAGNEQTFEFLEDVLDEVLQVFPSKYIHIGGDEVLKWYWNACPKCQARIKAEGLKDEHELQSYFVRRMERYLAGKGRSLIGWDEILEGGLAPNAVVMSWRSTKGGIAAAKAGHPVVMTPRQYCYFDYTYKSIDAKKAYGFDPLAGLAPQEAQLILGVQASFWSHIDREPPLVDRQIFPRLLSLAERAWSPATITDWAAFKPRLNAHLDWLDHFGVAYRREPPTKKTPGP